MTELKELEWVFVKENEDGTKTYRPPNTEEVMDKINEIVRFVNYINRTKPNKPISPVKLRTL